MMDLSIIIPHFNSIDSLEVLLKTIPIKKNIEVIIVDDKSTKSNKYNLNLLQNTYEYDNILFLDNDSAKKGAGICRNIGLKNAQGNWILFADSDDYFKEGFMSKIEGFLNTTYDVVFFAPTSVNIDTYKKSDRHLKYETLINNYINRYDKKSELNLRYRFFVPWSKLIKKDLIFKHNIYFEDTLASNDVMFSTKVGHFMEEFFVTSENIYIATKGYSTLTTNIDRELYNTRVNVFIRYYVFLKRNLEEQNFTMLKLHGTGMLINGFKYNIDYNQLFTIYNKMKRNGVKIINKQFLNPLTMFNRAIKRFKKNYNNKRYIQ